jgi:hypothetical protein
MPSNKAKTMIQALSRFLLIAGLLTLAGCATTPAPVYQPSVANTEMLLKQPKTSLGVATFNAASDVDDARLGIRGSSLTSASNGKFSAYLHDATVTELKTAGRWDPNARLQISGTLERNHLDGGSIKTGSAELGAHFVITKDGQKIYDKSLSVQHQWESSFIGAIAIPAAMQNYVTTVQLLLGKFFSDPDFISATQNTGSSN